MIRFRAMVLAGAALTVLAVSAAFPEAKAGKTDKGEAGGPLSRAASLAASCSGCHAGQSKGIPSLDDLDAAAIADTLLTYKTDEAGTTVMHRLARGYTQQEIDQIAAYLQSERE